jgi:hypothetical protein
VFLVLLLVLGLGQRLDTGIMLVAGEYAAETVGMGVAALVG